MSTAVTTLLSRGTAAQPAPAKPEIVDRWAFWKEFLRVQCDKFILAGLIIFLWKIGQFDDMKYVIGGLIVAINHNRFRWS